MALDPAIAAENKALRGGFQGLTKQIPWGSLGDFPKKFATVGKMFGIDANDINIAKPLEDILRYVKLMFEDINKLRVRNYELEKRVKELENKLK